MALGAPMRRLILVLFLLACSPVFATALSVSLVSGASVGAVPHNFTGNGKGFSMGAFDVANPHTAGLVLHDVTLSAVGSGDDSTAFSEVGLFVDANASGTFDPGSDVRYGSAYVAYPSDDGSLTFNDSIGFAPGETKRFIIVVKLAGTVLPVYQHGFRAIVSSISATGAAPTGVPTTFNEGCVVINAPTPLRLEYDVTGAAPPYSYDFRLVLDNHNGSWSSGQQWTGPRFGQAVFGNGGTAPFVGWVTNTASYPVGPFVTTPWWNATVGGVSYDSPGLFDNVAPYDPWVPTTVGDQLVWWGTVNTFLNDGEMAWSMPRVGSLWGPGAASLEPAHRVGDYLLIRAGASLGVETLATDTGSGNGFAIGAFDVISHTSAATFSSVTVDASGTGNDASAFTDIRLFVDTNANGAYDPGVDTQFGGAFTAYPADNGQLTFSGTLNFAAGETKRLMVVAKLNGATLATFGQTFDTTVTAISATGNMHSGLPTAVIPGIHIEAPTLTLTTSAAVQSVFADAQGPGGIGLQAAEFVLVNNAVGTANLDSITIAAAGAMFDQTDFSFVGLYEDTNASGSFDAGDASVAPTVAAFPSDDGALTFAQALPFAPGQSRRFFLVVKLAGSAAAGADFWCRMSALGVSGGSETIGVPGILVESLNIIASPTPPTGNGDGGDDGGGCSTDAGTSAAWLALGAMFAGLFAAMRIALRRRES